MDTAPSKSRLLLVDGDPKSLRVLDVSLKKAGFDVTTATSGREALGLLEASVPDLIISDTDLDDMDGFALCSQIKSRSEWSKLPFLFVSGRKSIEDKIRGLELGVEDYLSKPIYIKEIGIRVRTALQRAERERMESRREGRTRFAGDLSDVGVVDLVQTIELNRKSGIIHIVNRDNRPGSIFFRDGKVIDAEVGRLSGANAVYRLFSWSEGQFAVEFKQIRRHDVVDTPMAPLLMEGMRRLDETTRLLDRLPSARAVLEVDCRVLAEELAELPDEMNSVLRLCDGNRTLQEIVEDSDHPDLEALTIISKLFAGQILFAREAPDRAGEAQPGERLARWLSDGAVEDGLAADDRSASAEFSAMTELEHSREVVLAAGPGSQSAAPSEAAPGQSQRHGALSDAANKGLAGEPFQETLPSGRLDGDEGRTHPARPVDTLKGVPLESLFSPKANLPTEASSPTLGALLTPGPDELAAPPQPVNAVKRPTKPLGLAERMLSEDSEVRAAAMHEAISDGAGRIAGVLPTERNTREYGSPQDAAAALVEDVVSAAHPSEREHKQPAAPARLADEVNWGEWSTAGTQGEMPPELGIAVLPPVASPPGSAPPESRPEVGSSPCPAATSLDTSDDAPIEQSSADAIEPSQSPANQSTAVPAAQPAPEPELATATAQPAELAHDANTRSRPLWLLAVAAFVVGAVGFTLLSRKAPAPESASEHPSPAAVPSPVLPDPAKPAAQAVSQPTDQPAAPGPNLLADLPPPVGRRGEAPRPVAQPTEAPATVKSTAAFDAHRKCLDLDAGGKGKAKAVASVCRPAMEANPSDLDVIVILARAELDRGRLVEAKSLAKRALSLDPQRLEAYIYLGNAEQEAGKTEEARAAYKKYLELAPSGPFARELRSILSSL
jgi:CheY-like chemotaxis protein